jgi:hypothetical protein
MRHLAHVRALDMSALDYTKQTFSTATLPGEMGAGTAVLVTRPATVRPIAPDKPWVRARPFPAFAGHKASCGAVLISTVPDRGSG